MEMEEETDDFDKTLIWSAEEEMARANRGGETVGTFYLVLLAGFIFIVVFFILYFANRSKRLNALDMIQDPDNVFDGQELDDEENSVNEIQEKEETLPLIDIPEEEVPPETQAPVADNMLPKPVEVK